MIKPAKEKHLNAILEIEKMVFTQPWLRKQLKNDLTLRNNTENWVYLAVSIINKPTQTLYQSMSFLQKGIPRDYYVQGDHAFLY